MFLVVLRSLLFEFLVVVKGPGRTFFVLFQRLVYIAFYRVRSFSARDFFRFGL